jgi:hypothetical protein
MQAWAAAATGNSRLTNSDGRRHQGARTGPLFAHTFALSPPDDWCAARIQTP